MLYFIIFYILALAASALYLHQKKDRNQNVDQCEDKLSIKQEEVISEELEPEGKME